MLFTGKIYFLNFSITQFSGGLKDNYELKNDAYDVSWSGMTPYLANCKVWDIWQIAELRVCDIMTADSIIWDRFKVQVCGFRFFFACCQFNTCLLCCSTTATSAMVQRSAFYRWAVCCVQLPAVERVYCLNQEWGKLYVRQEMD